MKAVYVAKQPLQGSRYKFARMFERVCDVRTVDRIGNAEMRWADIAIVRGDRSSDYQQPLSRQMPYVLIEHDVWSVRAGKDTDEVERQMLEGASSVIFTSAHHEDLAGKYELPPSYHVHLRPLAEDLDFEPLPKLDGMNLVYAGGVQACGGKGLYGYRDYRDIFVRLMRIGWTVHVYPAWNNLKHVPAYARIGCVVHDPTTQSELYRELSQYQAGFQGYATHGPQRYVKSCRPNKLWEYLAAGIPTLGHNTGSGGDIYDGKWGHVAPMLSDLERASRKVMRMSIPEALRRSEVIDNDIEVFHQVTVAALENVKKTYRLKYAVDFDGRHWPRGASVTHVEALAMKAAGVIKGANL